MYHKTSKYFLSSLTIIPSATITMSGAINYTSKTSKISLRQTFIRKIDPQKMQRKTIEKDGLKI